MRGRPPPLLRRAWPSPPVVDLSGVGSVGVRGARGGDGGGGGRWRVAVRICYVFGEKLFEAGIGRVVWDKTEDLEADALARAVSMSRRARCRRVVPQVRDSSRSVGS
jgi:hypothetical protein